MNDPLTTIRPSPSPTPDGVSHRIERTLAAYGALAARDADALVQLVAPDLTVHVPGTHALAGTHRGVEAVLGFVVATGELTDDGEHIEVLDVLAGAEHDAVLCRVTATREGRAPLDNHTIHLVRHAGDRLAEVWIHNRDDLAVDAFWR